MRLAPLIRRRLPICCHRSDLPGAGTGVATSSHDGSHVSSAHSRLESSRGTTTYAPSPLLAAFF